MTTLIEPPCASCGRPSCRIELTPPAPGQQAWQLRYTGPVAGGSPRPVTAEEAARFVEAFSAPYHFATVHAAGLYDDGGFCAACDTAYCVEHWHLTSTGYGWCPSGHGKSLDPHWSPED